MITITSIIKTGSLDNAIREFSLAWLSWYIYGLETVVSVLFSNTRTRLLYNE